MYDELYSVWRLETENAALGSLPSDFYVRLSTYLCRLKEETQLIDTKGLKARLLECERENAVRMTKELTSARHRKIAKMLVASKKVPLESLAVEERAFYCGVEPSSAEFGKFVQDLSQGQLIKISVEAPAGAPSEFQAARTRVTLRCLKPVPSIIGVDMKSYGPFLVEDVASVPVENAKILIKQGLAKAVEVQP